MSDTTDKYEGLSKKSHDVSSKHTENLLNSHKFSKFG